MTTYTLTGTTGATGSLLQSTGSSINWTSPVYTIATQGSSGNVLQVSGDANFDGDVRLKGKSLVDSLDRIEERLAILRPNEELEEKWEQLRDLRKAYMELEAEIKEKEHMWSILKR
jgi:hypothetical protein